METEIWKDIKGFEGSYQISSLGNVKSFKSLLHGYILSNKNQKGGYLSIVLNHNDKIRYTIIHRIVAKHFIENPLNKKQVNHKNGIKTDSRVCNLELCTPKENVNHAIGLNPDILIGMIKHNKDRRSKIIQMDLNGGFVNIFDSGVEASKQTGVCQRNIYQVASGSEYKKGKTRKQAVGFVWKYKTICN